MKFKLMGRSFSVPAVIQFLLVYMFFQLPGVEACDRYSFRYGRNPLVELPLMFNPAGSARAQPKTSSPYTSLVIR